MYGILIYYMFIYIFLQQARLLLESKRCITRFGQTQGICARWEVPHYFAYIETSERKYTKISAFEMARWPDKLKYKYFKYGAKAKIIPPILIEFYTWREKIKCKASFSAIRTNRYGSMI